MRELNITHIAFAGSLIFHTMILSINISVNEIRRDSMERFSIKFISSEERNVLKPNTIAASEQQSAYRKQEIKKFSSNIKKESYKIETPASTAEARHPVSEIIESHSVTAIHPAETVTPEVKTQTVIGAGSNERDSTYRKEDFAGGFNISEIAKGLRDKIEAMKRYPYMARRKGIEGAVVVLIRLDKEGEIMGVHLKKSSGHSILDDSAVSLVKKACPFRHNAGKDIAIEIPITYSLLK